MKDNMKFLKGMGLGMVAGVGVSMIMMPENKRSRNKMMNKALRTVEDLADNISSAMNN